MLNGIRPRSRWAKKKHAIKNKNNDIVVPIAAPIIPNGGINIRLKIRLETAVIMVAKRFNLVFPDAIML